MRSTLSWLVATAFYFSTLAAPTPSALPLNTSPAVRRDLYRLQGEDTAYRKELIVTAFYEALTLADTARSSHNDRIFKKYFRPQDRAVVNQVFSNILGSNPKIGAPQLGDITVVFEDPERVCQDRFRGQMKYSLGPPPTITVCDALWTYTGTTFEHKECRQLGTAVSAAMQTISSIVLHELTHSALAAQSVPGQRIQDWDPQTGVKYAGPQLALYIAKHGPDVTIRSAANYQWFAEEVYWSRVCKRTYRNPRNELEAVRGTCGKEGCPPPDASDEGLK